MLKSAVIFNFGRVRHVDDWNFNVPGSVFWRIYRVLEGSAEVRIYGRVFSLTPGHLYLIPAFEPHEDMLHGEFVHEYLHFGLENGAMTKLLDAYELAFEAECTEVSDAIFEQMGRMLTGFELGAALPQDYEKKSRYEYWSRRYDACAPAMKMQLDGFIVVLLGLFMERSRVRKDMASHRVASGRRLILSGFAGNIRIDGIAARVGMRPESFIRAFRTAYGITPHDFLLRKRLDDAKYRLVHTTDSIKQIAFECGFGSAPYFCKLFRRYTMSSPGAFRRTGGELRD